MQQIYIAPNGFADVLQSGSHSYRVRSRIRGAWKLARGYHNDVNRAMDLADSADNAIARELASRQLFRRIVRR